MSEGPSSPALAPAAAPLPEVDDILREILLRLPPLPSSLPRASLVCKRWRRLVSDPRFLRRFRAHHRTPPLLGFFIQYPTEPIFVPTLDRPNRIPRKRFSFPPFPFNGWSFHGCRHGLALLFDLGLLEAIVWDPVTGSQHRVPLPPGLNVDKGHMCSGAVLRAAGDHGNGVVHGDCRSRHFQLVFLCNSDTHVFPCLYKSESAEWGNVSSIENSALYSFSSNVLVGNALLWSCAPGILEFDLDRQSLAVIQMPHGACLRGSVFDVLRTEDGELGLVISSIYSIHFWARNANSDGVFRWMFRKTVDLDKLLSLRPSMDSRPAPIVGFDEDNNSIFLWTTVGVFMIHLESMHFKKVLEHTLAIGLYPFSSFFTAVGGGDDRAEMLNNS